MTHPEPPPPPPELHPWGPGRAATGSGGSAGPQRPARHDPVYGASIVVAMQRFFTKYATFRGRASLSEFWWSWLVVGVVTLGIELIMSVLDVVVNQTPLEQVGDPLDGAWLIPGYVWSLGTFLPSLAVTVRRLHDSRLSGWWVLLAAPAAIGIVVIGEESYQPSELLLLGLLTIPGLVLLGLMLRSTRGWPGNPATPTRLDEDR